MMINDFMICWNISRREFLITEFVRFGSGWKLKGLPTNGVAAPHCRVSEGPLRKIRGKGFRTKIPKTTRETQEIHRFK